MKQFLLMLAALMVYGGSLLAQAPGIQWQNELGGTNYDYAYSIQQTADGGYIVAGSTVSNDIMVSGNHGGLDYWVVKLDASGAPQWQKCLGGSGNDEASSIRQTADGGYIVAGYTVSNDGNVSGNHGSLDYWVVKLDASGAMQWQKCLGGSGYDWASSIQQAADGGYIVAGYTNSTDGDVSGNHGKFDYWVVKLDASGAIQWQKCLGGSNDDEASSMQQTADGGYIVAGYAGSTDGDVNGVHGDADYWVVKLDASGAVQWDKALGGSNYDKAYSIRQTADGGYIVAGTTVSNDGNVSGAHGGGDYWVVKLDVSGAIQWQKCLGGSGAGDYATSIRQTADGGYIVAGATTSNDGDVSGNHGSDDYWVVKLDASGTIKWQKCLGGTNNDIANSIQQTADGGYIVAGWTGSTNGDVNGNYGGYDYWVVKLNADALLPVIFSSFNAKCESNGAYLQWSTGTETNSDHFIVEKSTDGIAWNDLVNINASGIASGYSFQDHFAGPSFYRLKVADKDGRLSYSKIIHSTCDVKNITVPLYPNPAEKFTNLVFHASGDFTGSITILDANGKTVRKISANVQDGNNVIRINLMGLSKGIYMVTMKDRDININKQVEVR